MEEKKKFLIASFPIFVLIFVTGWVLVGLKDALLFMGAYLFIVALPYVLSSWTEFVYKHM